MRSRCGKQSKHTVTGEDVFGLLIDTRSQEKEYFVTVTERVGEDGWEGSGRVEGWRDEEDGFGDWEGWRTRVFTEVGRPGVWEFVVVGGFVEVEGVGLGCGAVIGCFG